MIVSLFSQHRIIEHQKKKNILKQKKNERGIDERALLAVCVSWVWMCARHQPRAYVRSIVRGRPQPLRSACAMK